MPFDYAAYKAAMRTMGLWVDPRGNPSPGSPDVLVCKKNSSVHHKAQEILGALKSGKIPESNDNDGSAGGTFRVLPLDYLTKDAAWGMFDSSRALGSPDEGFQHVEALASDIGQVHSVYKTLELQVRAHSIFVQGHNSVTRSWVWSEGDSSTS